MAAEDTMKIELKEMYEVESTFGVPFVVHPDRRYFEEPWMVRRAVAAWRANSDEQPKLRIRKSMRPSYA